MEVSLGFLSHVPQCPQDKERGPRDLVFNTRKQCVGQSLEAWESGDVWVPMVGLQRRGRIELTLAVLASHIPFSMWPSR